MKLVMVISVLLTGSFSFASQEATFEAWNQKILSVIYKFAGGNLDASSIQCENEMSATYPGRYDRCAFSMRSAATSCYVHATAGGLKDSPRINSTEQDCNYAIYHNTWHFECRDTNGYSWRKYLPRSGTMISACVDNVYTRRRR